MGERGGLEFFSFPGLSVIPNSVAFLNVSVGVIEAQLQTNGTGIHYIDQSLGAYY